MDSKSANLTPIVYLTGAGPGDPELLTLKAKRVIEEADVIVYDSLISEDLLNYAKKECEIIYAGKRSSNHTLPQYSINELLAKKAKENKVVVRLKGGDPFLYGRGGEEAEKLYEEGIAFEIIPGISSSFAVPAYAGIPLTHRQYSSTVAIVTGHEGDHKEKSTIKWDNIVGASTIVVLMGYKNLNNIIKDMITAGKDKNTKAAVIQEGTTPNQKVAVGTLKTIVAEVDKHGLKNPLILVVGGVVGLREKISWFEKKPLHGVKIVVTRSTDHASVLSDELKRFGAKIINLPLIEIKKKSKNINEKSIYKSIEDFNAYHYIIFTSTNAVSAFFEKIYASGFDARCFYGKKIISVGKATCSELKKYGVIPDILPEDFSQGGLIKEFEKINLKNKTILFPQALKINQDLPEFLISKGAILKNLPVYETIIPEKSIKLAADLFKNFDPKNPPVDFITFTSYSTVDNFISCIEATEKGLLNKIALNVKFASIGKKTADYALGFNIKSDIISKDVTIGSLVKEIVGFYKNNKKQ